MPAIPFLGLGISDLAKLNAQAYNAKSLGEQEAERIRIAEEERNEKRRRDALEQALRQLQIDETRVNIERRRKELERIREGLTPTPQSDSDGLFRGLPEDEFRRQYGVVTELEAERATRVTGAREEAAAPYRARNQTRDDVPNLNMIQDASNEIVEQMLAGNPLITPDQMYQIVSSEEGLAQLTPPLRLLVEGGQVNLGTLTAAHTRKRGSAVMNEAAYQELKQTIDAACQRGVSTSVILQNVRQNPNYSRYEDSLRSYIGSLQCGASNGGR